MALKARAASIFLLICSAYAFALSVERVGETVVSSLFWEAESTADMHGPTACSTDSYASGGAFIPLTGGTLKYTVWVEIPGDYVLWGRVIWRDGCNDAVLTVVNVEQRSVLGNDANYGVWHWARGGEYHLHAGNNSVVIEGLFKNDVQLDCFLMTTDQDATIDDGCIGITGTKAIAFNDDFFKRLTHYWKVLSGDWAIGGTDGLHYIEQADTCLAVMLTGKESWVDYSIQAAVRMPERGSTGVVFAYVDDDNHCVTRIDRRDCGYMLRIEETREGQGRILHGSDRQLSPE